MTVSSNCAPGEVRELRAAAVRAPGPTIPRELVLTREQSLATGAEAGTAHRVPAALSAA